MEGFKEYQPRLLLPLWISRKPLIRSTEQLCSQCCDTDSIPKCVVNAIQALCSNSSSAVIVDGSISEPFDVTTGVLEGNASAHLPFIILVDYLMGKAFGPDSGVVTCLRQ